MASATSSKSELLFALYLCPVICARQCRLLRGLDVVPEVQPQRSWEQVRHREHCRNPSSCWDITSRSQPVEQHKESWKAELYLPEAGDVPSLIDGLVQALPSSNAVPTAQTSPDLFTCTQQQGDKQTPVYSRENKDWYILHKEQP